MKHYIEIQRLRTQDVVVDDTLTLEKNTDAFIQGDIISITEKIDGANSSIYNHWLPKQYHIQWLLST